MLAVMANGDPERDNALEENTLAVQSLRTNQRPLGALLRVTHGSTSKTLQLSRGRCVVGSGSTCDLVLSSSTISRQHVEFVVVPEGVAVRDLGSTNGTYYLGHRVQEMILSFGARVSIGDATIAVDLDPASLPPETAAGSDEYRGIVGRSPAMRRLFAILTRLEGSLVPALIVGESGVGKELIARALHEGSAVSNGPLVTLNCGAISREVVASELFGHKKGAFTGALEARKGAFASADGGTLFLDEIGEMPIEVQPMLLRALESGEVRSVGSDQARHVKVRVVAATNRDLLSEVDAGRFREDLYYRLAVVRLDVPPLSERPEDIDPLARRFARAAGLEDLPDAIVAQCQARSWDGNARELRNAIQAYVALGVLLEPRRRTDGLLDVALGNLVDLSKPYLDQKDGLVDRFTILYLRALLERARGNKSEAARIAGLDRTYLGRMLARYGLK